MNSLIGTAQFAPPAPLDALVRGSRAGSWVVERELGHGGMGTVYAVIHEDIGKRAALKIIHRNVFASRQTECVLAEARVVNLVDHPNIVDIFETGSLDDGRPYMVMERLEGVSLAARLAAGRLLPDVAVAILLQICDALIATHAAGFVHRDLKSANVFLIGDDRNPRVKVLDWGIAKQVSSAAGVSDGLIVGTPAYLSPEQARGAALTDRTDVYSLGVMAYELFLEQLPFEGHSLAETLEMHQRSAPPLPQDIWPNIPRELQSLLLAMLAKDPERRPNARGVATRLEATRVEIEARKAGFAAAQLETWKLGRSARWVPRLGRRQSWRYAIGACAVVVLTAAALVVRGRDGDAGALSLAVPTPAPLSAEIDASAVARREVNSAIDDRVAIASPTAPAASTPRPLATHPPARSSQHAAHSHSATAHARPRVATAARALDPDGALEPYP